MSNTFLSPIIKSSNVDIGGVFQLPIGPAARSAPAGGGLNPQTGGQASARVIETTAEYATIEIVCPCGTVSKIRCSYSN